MATCERFVIWWCVRNMRKHQTHPQCRGWHRSAYWWQPHCIYLHWSSPPLWSPPEAQKHQIQAAAADDYDYNNNNSFIGSLTVFISSHQGSQGHFLHMPGSDQVIFSFITMVVSDKVRQGRLYISPQGKRHLARSKKNVINGNWRQDDFL